MEPGPTWMGPATQEAEAGEEEVAEAAEAVRLRAF